MDGLKSHSKSEALLWLSSAAGHAWLGTVKFSAYLCDHYRPPVKKNRNAQVNLLLMVMEFWDQVFRWLSVIICDKQVILSYMKLLQGSDIFDYKIDPDIYRETVHGRLRWVHNEVPQGEPKPLGCSLQKHCFGSWPWKLLFWRVLHCRRASQASPFRRLILIKEERWWEELNLSSHTFTFTLKSRTAKKMSDW